VAAAADACWVKSNMADGGGGGGGGQITSGASGGGNSRRRSPPDPGPENAASRRSSNPNRTELCGGTTPPHDVPTTGDGRWNDDRLSCLTFGASRPEPEIQADMYSMRGKKLYFFQHTISLMPFKIKWNGFHRNVRK